MIEIISKLRSQLNALFGDMQPHQKMTMVTLGLLVMVPFGMLIFGGAEGGMTPLQFGAAFDTEVRAQAEQALIERGFNDFETVGQRIMAPSSKVEEYNGALMAAGISSPRAYDELEAALKEVNPFTPQSQFAALMDVQLSKKIRNNLRAIDGVRDAQVIWSRPQGQSRWNRANGAKASVHVTPDGGRELPRRLVESLRNSVATMVPDLERENVVVIDRSTGQSWSGNDPGDPFDNRLEELKRSRVQFHQSRISDALSQIVSNAVVAVYVDFDNVMSARERSQQIDKGAVELSTYSAIKESTSNEGPAAGVPGTAANRPGSVPSSNAQQAATSDKDETTKSYSVPSMTISETERVPLAEKSLQVAVSIPKGHIEQLVIRDGVPQGTTDAEKDFFNGKVKEEEESLIGNVKKIVARLIPPDSPEEAISVTTHRRIEQDLPPMELPFTDMLKDFVSTWGSSIALSLFGLWALMLLKKSMPVSEATPSTAALDKLTQAVTTAADAEVALAEAAAGLPGKQAKALTNRDTLLTTVEDDPATAAAIISKWLQNA